MYGTAKNKNTTVKKRIADTRKVIMNIRKGK